MRSKDIRRLTVDIRKMYGIDIVNLYSLKKIIETYGYTIIEFDESQNDEDVSIVIEKLDLTDFIIRHKGFSYADADCRLVFIWKDLDDQEKLIILAHELGHISCNHLSHAPILGTCVIEEDEANQFAHYLLRPTFADTVVISSNLYKKRIIIACCVLLLLSCVFGIGVYSKKQEKYCEDYYITTTGEKYHEAGCMFVKDKKNVHRMTIEEFESGKYTPCQMCLPN